MKERCPFVIEYRNLTPFQRALLDSVLNEHKDVTEETTAVIFSQDFIARTSKLLKQTQGTISFRTKRILKNILIAAILVTLLTGSVMAIPAVREAVVDFFLQVKDDRVGITFDPEEAATAPLSIETVYAINFLPPGYEMVVNDCTQNQVNVWWTNDQNEWISYYQFTIPNDTTEENWFMLDLPTEGNEKRIVTDYLVEIIRSEGFYHLVWTNNEYVFVLELPDTIDDDTMLKIFMSWHKVSIADKSE